MKIDAIKYELTHQDAKYVVAFNLKADRVTVWKAGELDTVQYPLANHAALPETAMRCVDCFRREE